MNKVIIIGNDHPNTIGLVHCLGSMGLYTIVVMWGAQKGLVKSSKFVSEVYTASSSTKCMQTIINKFGHLKEKIVLFPSCDEAALVIEEFRTDLPDIFLFQNTKGKYSISEINNKNLQIEVAEKCGFNIPKTWLINSINDIPDNLLFPSIIKPTLIGELPKKKTLIVCENMSSLKKEIEFIFSKFPDAHLQVQQYIDKENDYDVMGCRYSNGEISKTVCLKKLGIYPPKVGLATISKTITTPNDIKNAVINFLEEIDYYGIFDFEFMHSITDGKNYFIECNLRNSGSNEFAFKSGVNIPYLHYLDIVGKKNSIPTNIQYKEGLYFMREYHYLEALLAGKISIGKCIKDLIKLDGFLIYLKEDRKPFYYQFYNKLSILFRLRKPKYYK